MKKVPSDSQSMDLNSFLDLLASPYRRQLLMTLLEHNPEDEASIPESLASSDEELDGLIMEMTHVHLPKMEELGIIEWSRENNVVTKGPRFDELRPLLELIDKNQNELPEGWL